MWNLYSNILCAKQRAINCFPGIYVGIDDTVWILLIRVICLYLSTYCPFYCFPGIYVGQITITVLVLSKWSLHILSWNCFSIKPILVFCDSTESLYHPVNYLQEFMSEMYVLFSRNSCWSWQSTRTVLAMFWRKVMTWSLMVRSPRRRSTRSGCRWACWTTDGRTSDWKPCPGRASEWSMTHMSGSTAEVLFFLVLASKSQILTCRISLSTHQF